jgi:hypothetical protein
VFAVFDDTSGHEKVVDSTAPDFFYKTTLLLKVTSLGIHKTINVLIAIDKWVNKTSWLGIVKSRVTNARLLALRRTLDVRYVGYEYQRYYVTMKKVVD